MVKYDNQNYTLIVVVMVNSNQTQYAREIPFYYRSNQQDNGLATSQPNLLSLSSSLTRL